MSVEDHYRSIVARLRGWGFEVLERNGAYGRNNGLGNWNNGSSPDGHLNHHFVCSLNPSLSYIDGLVGMLEDGYGETPGPVVNWFADVHGRAHLIATRPANHSGKGNYGVLENVRNDVAPSGPAAMEGLGNDFTGNGYYSGTESQHPGDSTPWPDDLLDVMVAICAAEAIEFGWTPNRIIDHYEHTDRKVDMSFMGGPNSRDGSNEFRRRVAARMNGDKGATPIVVKPTETPKPPVEQGLVMDQEVKEAFESLNQSVRALANKPVAAAAVPSTGLCLFKLGKGIGVANLANHTWRGLGSTAELAPMRGVMRYPDSQLTPIDAATVARVFGKQVS